MLTTEIKDNKRLKFNLLIILFHFISRIESKYQNTNYVLMDSYFFLAFTQ